ncbi:hypothetical protein E4635_10140 [Flavobacterium humi]|uniref:Porin n=1 Tax=Flavobacterium humi TaxID=2562683 RepID=A0A4Z0L6C1_9FLAO|nr:hypothetical protein E4635_10140 [Flavobacterium humi]
MPFLFHINAKAQIDPSLLKRIPKDTLKTLNMDAVYTRPALNINKTPIAIGGYLEANWQHLTTDGISEGHQFQARRLSVFMSSAISKRVKFLSEIEFEDGGKEIAVEFASVDVEFHPLVNFRAGIILNPIGSFNQNHDGPKWEFTDRPISATQMLPGTFSNAGAGLFGKKYHKDWMVGYEAYLSGSFDNSIIENTENKTFLPAAKENPERFEEINSGEPLFTGKLAVRNTKIGELGISYMGGIYNKFQEDGIILDKKRRVSVFALDFNTTLPKIKTFITTEFAWIKVDVPSTYTQQFGNKQYGGFIDIVQPVVRQTILGWDNAVLNVACRLEYVDWNVGKFAETGGNIGEDIWSIMPAISFRPTAQTVFRLNYRFQKQRDIFGNPPAITDGFNLGISTYF